MHKPVMGSLVKNGSSLDSLDIYSRFEDVWGAVILFVFLAPQI